MRGSNSSTRSRRGREGSSSSHWPSWKSPNAGSTPNRRSTWTRECSGRRSLSEGRPGSRWQMSATRPGTICSTSTGPTDLSRADSQVTLSHSGPRRRATAGWGPPPIFLGWMGLRFKVAFEVRSRFTVCRQAPSQRADGTTARGSPGEAKGRGPPERKVQ